MKKIMLTAVASVLATSAMAFDAYVGLERDTKAGDNTAYVGGSHQLGDLTLSTQLDLNMNSGNRGSVDTLNIDASYNVGGKLDVYLENDLNKDWKRTETTVGVRYNF